MSVDDAIEEVVEEVLEDQAEEVAEEVVEEVESNGATEAPVVVVEVPEGSPTEELSEALEVAEQIREITRDEILHQLNAIEASFNARCDEILAVIEEMNRPPEIPQPQVESETPPNVEEDSAPGTRHWLYRERWGRGSR